jgi:hypothetical protein
MRIRAGRTRPRNPTYDIELLSLKEDRDQTFRVGAKGVASDRVVR